MNPLRLAFLAVAAAAALLALAWASGSAALALEPRSLGFVVGLPWVVVLATLGPRTALAAPRHALGRRPEDLPHEARARSAAVLRMLGGLSVAAGCLGFFGGALALLHELAQRTGQVDGVALLGGAGACLVAPVHGLLLQALVYGPLAAALDGAADDGLGEALG